MSQGFFFKPTIPTQRAGRKKVGTRRRAASRASSEAEPVPEATARMVHRFPGAERAAIEAAIKACTVDGSGLVNSSACIAMLREQGHEEASMPRTSRPSTPRKSSSSSSPRRSGSGNATAAAAAASAPVSPSATATGAAASGARAASAAPTSGSSVRTGGTVRGNHTAHVCPSCGLACLERDALVAHLLSHTKDTSKNPFPGIRVRGDSVAGAKEGHLAPVVLPPLSTYGESYFGW